MVFRYAREKTGALTAECSALSPTYIWSTGATSQSIKVNDGNIYTVTVTDLTTGCQGSASGSLTFIPNTVSNLTEIACNSFTLNGQVYTSGGIYTQNLTNVAGCDSTITLNLTINYSTNNSIPATACESYLWHGTTYTATGTYTFNYTNESGCPSTDTLHLIINHGGHNSVPETACESYVWHQTTYTATGIYLFNYTNGSGCPSTDTLHLTINHGGHNSIPALHVKVTYGMGLPIQQAEPIHLITLMNQNVHQQTRYT